MHPAFARKSAGILVPVFSLRTADDGGIGTYLDALPFIDWLKDKGLSVLNILPLNESVLESGCPYTSLSAFALDPVMLKLEALEDVRRSPEALAVLRAPRNLKGLAAWSRAAEAQWLPVRLFKFKVLEKAFQRFLAQEFRRNTPRARAFRRFVQAHADWIDDYAAFRVLKEKYAWESWALWPEDLRRRDPRALARFRDKARASLDFYRWLQWLCYEQWGRVREHARARGVWLLGDMAFLVEKESADVWARQEEFSPDTTVGAPPDMFNPEGQRWGVPAYVWERLEATDFRWWRARLRQACELYDLFRIDHVVGFFRMFVYPAQGRPGFSPPDEPAQRRRGEAFLRLVMEEVADHGGSYPIAEDLGVIPDFVRAVMASLKIPGYKVLRWEKRGESFIDPPEYPTLSLAVPGTHDTSPLAAWYEDIPDGERWHLVSMTFRKVWEGAAPATLNGEILTGLQERLLGAGSAMALLPLQDVFGWKGQVNAPGTVGAHNWTWRMPVSLETLDADPVTRARGQILKDLVLRSGRLSPTGRG